MTACLHYGSQLCADRFECMTPKDSGLLLTADFNACGVHIAGTGDACGYALDGGVTLHLTLRISIGYGAAEGKRTFQANAHQNPSATPSSRGSGPP